MKTELPKYVELGWANDWRETPEMVKQCQSLEHRKAGYVTDTDVGPPHRGMDHVVICHQCQYRYHYDSSD